MSALDPEGACPTRRPLAARQGRIAAALALGAALAGCADDPVPPRWISLAAGFEPRPLAEQVAEWERAAGAPTGTRAEPEPAGLGLVHELPPSAWERAAQPGCRTLELPAGALRASGLRPRLVGRGREYPAAPAEREPTPGEIRLTGSTLTVRLPPEINLVPPSVLVLALEGRELARAIPSSAWRVTNTVGTFALELPKNALRADGPAPRLFAELVRVDEPRALAPFEYRFEGEHLTLCWPQDEALPAMQLAQRLENGRTVDGQWQVRSGRFCGAGIPVWSGGREERTLDVPRASQLSFRVVSGAQTSVEPARARVRLDGATLFETALAPGAEPIDAVVALPADGARGARLAFELEGPPGLATFFTPTIAPREHGTSGARPWATPAERERPDIVLFLVDTFRADNLAAYGGDAALAPNLNRFGERCRRFTEARSNAAWTLPSISSLLTGLHPGQHGATDEDLQLPAEHTTIAERLAAAGYRTGAITDGSFFAPIFGLDQGFEWFSEHPPPDWDLDRTLAEARAFLDHDDGRPVFLVVHTYRVHQPYRVGPDEDRRPYDALMETARVSAGTDSPTPAVGFGVLAQYEGELRALYHAGVRDLDRGFGEFLAALDERRYLEHGFLVLTSDHGEALGENHEFFHSGHLWEVKLRVPLFLAGPGLAPAALPHPAGPIDLAPTFAALAGIAADPSWVGRSLLAEPAPRASYAFQLGKKDRHVALLEGTHKVIAAPERARLEGGECDEAFELERDPLEEHDLARASDWPAELTRRLAPAVLRYLEPRAAAAPAGVSPELREALRGIGYGGEGDKSGGGKK